MNYRYFTFLTERDTIMWQGRERLSDVGKLDMKKGFLMQVDFEMPRRAFGCREIGHEKRLPDAGKI